MSKLLPNFLTEQEAVQDISRRIHEQHYQSVNLRDCPTRKKFAQGVSIDSTDFILEIEFAIGYERQQLGPDGVDVTVTHKLLPYTEIV